MTLLKIFFVLWSCDCDSVPMLVILDYQHALQCSNHSNMNTPTHTHTDTTDSSTLNTTSALDIPPGYCVHKMPDGCHYFIPDFMICSTDLAIETQNMMRSINVQKASGGVSPSITVQRQCINNAGGWCWCFDNAGPISQCWCIDDASTDMLMTVW